MGGKVKREIKDDSYFFGLHNLMHMIFTCKVTLGYGGKFGSLLVYSQELCFSHVSDEFATQERAAAFSVTCFWLSDDENLRQF